MQGIKKSNFSELLAKIGSDYQLHVPAEVDGVTRFTPYQPGLTLQLAQNTVHPPKELFFPQTEELYYYDTHKQAAQVREAVSCAEKKVLLGVRPCDVQSLAVLDDVFLTKGFVDTFYKNKRDNTVVIAIACQEPGPTCFCTSMGVDPGNAEGADIMMWEAADSYCFEAKSEQGKSLLAEISGLLEDLAPQKTAAASCSLQVEVEGLPAKLHRMFEHELWPEVSRKCLNCGTCTYLCPTCHCFDINGSTRGDKGIKFRCWDSCMYKEYTLMAGGHNPRPTKKERVRQRFLHKLQYIPERYGKLGCVGCGRCLVKCPVNVDITRIISQIREVSLDD